MFCARCGYQLDNDAKFCPRCGEKVGGEVEKKPQFTRPQSQVNPFDGGSQSSSNPFDGGSQSSSNPFDGGSQSSSNPFDGGSQSGSNPYNGGAQSSYDPYNGGSQRNSNPFDGGGSNNYNSNPFSDGYGSRNTGSGNGGNGFGGNSFLSMENIERFAPLAALVPLIMKIVIGLLGFILGAIFLHSHGGYTVYRIIMFILKAVFVLATGAATGGLVYLVVTEKDVQMVNTWIVPFGALMGFISCLCIAFNWKAVGIITGIIAFVLGLEFLARIVIKGMPIDSPIDPAGAFATYGEYISEYRAKYPTSKQLEQAGYVDPENSKFDGSGGELLGYMILTSIVCSVTCGIAAPWMICKLYKWRMDHTVINGKRLTFTGTGGSLLGHWILWEILTVITCGIYGFFLYVALRKWELNHTYIAGEPIVANGNESYFDGTSFELLGYSILGGILLTVTCGIAYPWVMAMIQKWDASHQVVNRRRMAFSGTGLGFLGEFILIAIFTAITCGIYAPWGVVRMNKYIIRNTDFIN